MDPHLQLVLAELQDTLTLPCLPLALISILTVVLLTVCGGAGFSVSVGLSGKSFVLIEKVNAPSLIVKSGITLDKNIISFPSAISKSADSINEDIGCPL